MRIAASTFRVHALLLGSLVLGGCEEALPTAILDDAPHAPIQTDREIYTLDWDGAWYRTMVRYTFLNRTGHEVFIVNCNGAFALRLERWTGSRWLPAWSPVLPDCLSPPIEIATGEHREFTLEVVGARPSGNHYPQFDQATPSGWYRIVWMSALSSFQTSYPFGPEIGAEHRYSNPFRLRVR
jgi:hypothetical protein